MKSWSWIPTLYFAQGLPYVVVMTVAGIMLKRLGMSNADLALYTSGLYLPWVIKPLWSPLVDILKTKRWWIVVMQIVIGAALGGVAFTLQAPFAIRCCLSFMWLAAFSSATHDIAADGFYMLALTEQKQAYFIGIRNTFYRIAVIFGQGILVMFAGMLEEFYSERLPEAVAVPRAWAVTFYILTALFVLLCVYHRRMLPRPDKDCAVAGERRSSFREVLRDFGGTFAAFFRKEGIVPALLFILFYRFAESQLVKITAPFLLDAPEAGGLGLSTAQVGFVYGTVGVVALTLGGIAGGIVLSRKGLRACLWGMTVAMNLPNLVYLYLAMARPSGMAMVSGCVAVEQLGYGFGFTSLTCFMMLFSAGRHQTAHYALCTGFMALGMMTPGMFSGWLEEWLGYRNFFVWIMGCTLPSFWVTARIRPLLDKRFRADNNG